MTLSTSPFAIVFSIYVSLRKMVFIWKERHIKAYFIMLIRSLWLSPSLTTDHPNTVGVFLNIYKIQMFKLDLILGSLFTQAMYLKSQTE